MIATEADYCEPVPPVQGFYGDAHSTVQPACDGSLQSSECTLQYNRVARVDRGSAPGHGDVDGEGVVMARPERSVLRRILVQADCAFWCIHDHLDVLAYLGLPTLVALLAGAMGLVGVWRTWDLPGLVDFLLAGVVVPFAVLFIFTALPLPCAVFAWKAAEGERPPWRVLCLLPQAGEAIAGRVRPPEFALAGVALASRLAALLGLAEDLPDSAVAPPFEDERRIFRRSRRISAKTGRPSHGLSLSGHGARPGRHGRPAPPGSGDPRTGHAPDRWSWRPAVVDQLWISRRCRSQSCWPPSP